MSLGGQTHTVVELYAEKCEGTGEAYRMIRDVMLHILIQ